MFWAETRPAPALAALAEDFRRVREGGCGGDGEVEEKEEDAFPHGQGKLEAFSRLCLLVGYSCAYFPLLRRENKNHRAF